MALVPIKKDGSETGSTSADKINLGFLQTDENKNNVEDLANPEKINFTPITESIPVTEGTVYYDPIKHALTYQTDIDGVNININMENIRRLKNNTGVTIINGTPLKQVGSDDGSGIVSVALAQADTFTNAGILVVATHDILNQQEGWGTYNGDVGDVNLASVAETGQTLVKGSPIYLSEIEAGKYTMVAPDIASRVGGFLTGVQGTSDGNMAVLINNLINLPSTQAYLQKPAGTGSYALTAGVSTSVTDYLNSGSLVMTFDALLGTIQPLFVGVYALNFTFSGTTTVEKQSLDIEIYDIDTATVLYLHTLPTGRDLDGGKIATSFQVPGNLTNANANIIIRLRPDADMTIVLNQVSFSINSLHIR